MNITNITIFGASGRVGQQLVALALAQGFIVTAFVHKRNPFSPQPGLKVVQGDIIDPAAVARALNGSNAVISTLGSWGTKDKNILTVGMKTILPEMERQGIKRIITLTGSDASWSGDKPTTLNKLVHALLKTIAPKVLQDSEIHLRLLEASNLDWTSVRSPPMTNQANPLYKLSLKTGLPLASIPRAAVVQALIDQIGSSDYIQKAPVIHRA